MVLPVGNGVTDGSLPFIVFFLYMGVHGNKHWTEEYAMNMTLADIFAYGLTLLQIQIMARNVWMILADRNAKKDPEVCGEEFEFKNFAI